MSKYDNKDRPIPINKAKLEIMNTPEKPEEEKEEALESATFAEAKKKSLSAPKASAQSYVSSSAIVEVNQTNNDEIFKKEIEKRDLDNATLRENVNNLKQDRELRFKFSKAIFFLVVSWIFLVFAVLCAVATNGFSTRSFTLSDSVIIALISGTTINILGLFLVVVNYLFPKSK